MAKSSRTSDREEYWRRLIGEQHNSGLSVRRFCAERGLSEPMFYVWRKRFRQAEDEPVTTPPGRLIPVHVVSEFQTGTSHAPDVRQAAGDTLEITTPGGFTLRVGGDVKPERVTQLLGLLVRFETGGRSC